MKKGKKKLKEAFFELAFEIVFTLLFFGIGALIINAFGIELDAQSIDFDLIVLLGIVALIIVFGAVYALIQRFKKTSNKSRK